MGFNSGFKGLNTYTIIVFEISHSVLRDNYVLDYAVTGHTKANKCYWFLNTAGG